MTHRVAADARHDPVIRQLHWTTALVALITVALAWGMLIAPRHGEARGWAIVLHTSCGIVILGLAVFWSGWRLRHPAPPLRPALRAGEAALARATHAALLLLFVAMPLSGYVGLAAGGRPLSFFGLLSIPPLLPENGRLSQAAIALHLIGQFLIYGLVSAHVGAALLHLVIRRDGIFERMLPRRP